jgi:hypothetical protein
MASQILADRQSATQNAFRKQIDNFKREFIYCLLIGQISLLALFIALVTNIANKCQ